MITGNSLIGWEPSLPLYLFPKVGQKKLPVRNSTLSHSLKGWPNPLDDDVDDDVGDDVADDRDDDVGDDRDDAVGDGDVADDHYDDCVQPGHKCYSPLVWKAMLFQYQSKEFSWLMVLRF